MLAEGSGRPDHRLWQGNWGAQSHDCSLAKVAAVFLTARTQAELASTNAEINKFAKAGFATGDLTSALDCARIVGAARRKFRRVDILVNNAGHYGPVVPIEDYPLAEFDDVIAVHLRAAFLLSKLVLPNVWARLRCNPQYLQLVGKVRVRLGLRLCCSEGRNARTYTSRRSRGRTQGSAC